jgi:hypothetical protein
MGMPRPPKRVPSLRRVAQSALIEAVALAGNRNGHEVLALRVTLRLVLVALRRVLLGAARLFAVSCYVFLQAAIFDALVLRAVRTQPDPRLVSAAWRRARLVQTLLLLLGLPSTSWASQRPPCSTEITRTALDLG